MLDKLILGDNPFFGVDHMSEGRGMEKQRRFEKNEAILEVLDAAYDAGIRAFSFTTHDRVAQLCTHFRKELDRYPGISFYPALPYAHKYADLVNDKGLLGAVADVIFAERTLMDSLQTILRGGKALLTQEPIEMMKLLIDAELKMFHDLPLKVVFLQNIVTDLLLGLGIPAFFQEFSAYIEQNYQAKAGFITLNMPRLVDFLQRAGIEQPIVCSAINKIGFQMNPDRAAYERTLETKEFHPMAMSVMASGAIPPREALEYVTSLPRVESILFGASKPEHIVQTKQMMEELWRDRKFSCST